MAEEIGVSFVREPLLWGRFETIFHYGLLIWVRLSPRGCCPLGASSRGSTRRCSSWGPADSDPPDQVEPRSNVEQPRPTTTIPEGRHPEG